MHKMPPPDAKSSSGSHTKLLWMLLGCFVLGTRTSAALAEETKHEKDLRTDEAQTPEPLTEKPLKAAMQNLFLQEDPFPQPHLTPQAALRVLGDGFTGDEAAALEVSAAAELGLWDSWTVQLRAPFSLAPSDERGVGNMEASVLYSFWISKHEDFRLTANLRNVFPSFGSGDNAFAHDLSVIAYGRWAPLHLQLTGTLDISYGKDIPGGPRVRPAASAAAIVKLEDHAFVAEFTAQREFLELRYIAALGFFLYPGNFEIGAAMTLDVTKTPLALGAVGIVSYAFDSLDG
jgi:hypothetical protein